MALHENDLRAHYLVGFMGACITTAIMHLNRGDLEGARRSLTMAQEQQKDKNSYTEARTMLPLEPPAPLPPLTLVSSKD